MDSMDLHKVENLEIRETREVEGEGRRKIIVKNKGKKLMITLYSEEKENLEFE